MVFIYTHILICPFSTLLPLEADNRKSSRRYFISPSRILMSILFINIVFLYALFSHVDNAYIVYMPLIQIYFNTKPRLLAFLEIYSEEDNDYIYFRCRAYFKRPLCTPYLIQMKILRVHNSRESKSMSVLIKTPISHILLERFFSPTNLTCNFV